MKNLFCFLLLSFISLYYSKLNAQVTEKNINHTPVPRASKISGLITDYNPATDPRFVTFQTHDLMLSTSDTSVLINADGTFSAIITQPFDGDMGFMYDHEYILLYFIAATDLHLTIDKYKWTTSKNIVEAVSFRGKTAEMIKLMGNFKFAYDQKTFNTIEQWADTTKSDSVVAAVRIKKLHEELEFADNYFKENKITNKFFKGWEINKLKYSTGCDISGNCFANPRKKSLIAPALTNILKEINLDNIYAKHISAYYNYLWLLGGNFQVMVNINPYYAASVTTNGKNPVPVYFELIDRYTSGFAKQSMYCEVYFRAGKNFTSPYINNFSSCITDPYLKDAFIKRQLSAATFVPFNILEKIKAAKIDEVIQARIIDFFEKDNQHFIFIDFWGTWCSPCMSEMPLYRNLILQLSDENISFKFLAVSTNEKAATEVKEKNQIDGEFVILDDNETHLLNNILQFNNYPSHFLIAPNSIVIKRDFSRPITKDAIKQAILAVK